MGKVYGLLEAQETVISRLLAENQALQKARAESEARRWPTSFARMCLK